MTKTKAPAVNLFAAGTTVKPTTKKVEKKIIQAPELGDKVKLFAELKATIEASTAQLKMIEGDIKATGKELFLNQYRSQRSTPENFLIQDKTGAACMLIVQDKYTMVDETKAEILSEFDGLLDENVVYKFNPELVEKYGATLSRLIMNCKEIDAEDKPLLIAGEKSFSVKKGSIDRILQYDNPEQVFELINPILMLRK